MKPVTMFIIVLLAGSRICAQLTPASEGQSDPKKLTAGAFVLEDATPVRLQLKRTVSSADSHAGDTVDFEVLQDVVVNGLVVIPKGTFAFGTVTDAQETRKLGR